MAKTSMASIPFSVIACLSLFSAGCWNWHHHPYYPPTTVPPPGEIPPVSLVAVQRDTATGPPIFPSVPVPLGEKNIHASSLPLRIWLTNHSATTVSLGKPSVVDSNPSHFSIDSSTMKTQLAPNESTHFYVAFAPQSTGSKHATVEFDQSTVGPVSLRSTFSFSVVGTGTDNTVYVSSTGSDLTNDGLSTARPFRTIQAAINAVQTNKNGLYASKDTVFIRNGVYTEQLLLTSSLTLAGESKESTIIQAPAIIVENPVGSNDKDLVVIQGPTTHAEISHLTIAGPGPASCGSILSGVRVRGDADAYVHDSQLLSIKEEGVSGCQNGIGILVGYRSSDTTAIQNAHETATLWHNFIVDYQKGGIVVNGAHIFTQILQNQIIGAGLHPQIAQNGIELGYITAARVEGNTISRNMCDETGVCGVNFDKSDQDVSIGLYIFHYTGDNVSITDNVVSDNDFGIAILGDQTLGNPGIWVENNQILGNRYIQALLMQGSTALINNTLTGGKWGLVISSNKDALVDTHVQGEKNLITGNDVGIEILAGAGTPAGLLVTVDLSKGNIFGNTTWGIKNNLTTQSSVDVTHNFWGNANGPGGIGPGSGDKISGQVTFAPFATTPFPAPIFP